LGLSSSSFTAPFGVGTEPSQAKPWKRARHGPEPHLRRQGVDGHEADVVAVLLVLGLGIAETGEDQHRSGFQGRPDDAI
jgi:hypothetical protein